MAGLLGLRFNGCSMGVTDVALAHAAPRPANLPTIMNNGRNIAATNSAKGVPDRC